MIPLQGGATCCWVFGCVVMCPPTAAMVSLTMAWPWAGAMLREDMPHPSNVDGHAHGAQRLSLS